MSGGIGAGECSGQVVLLGPREMLFFIGWGANTHFCSWKRHIKIETMSMGCDGLQRVMAGAYNCVHVALQMPTISLSVVKEAFPSL